MPLNSELKRLLDDNLIPQSPEGLAAVDAILLAGQADDAGAQTRFRQAVYAHRVIWNPRLDGIRHINEHEDPALDDFLVAAGEPADNSFPALVSSAAKRRVLNTLPKATEEQLTVIMSAPGAAAARRRLFGDDGNSIFGQPPVRVANWNPENNQIINPAAIEEIQLAAKLELLNRKIASFNHPDAKAKLERLALTEDNDEFQGLVRELFGSRPDAAHAIADRMQREQVQAGIRGEAAKKAVLLGIKDLPDADVLDGGLAKLNAGEIAEFRHSLAGVSGAVEHLAERDMNEIKAVLGARFLILKAAELGDDEIDRMENIALSDNPDEASDVLKEIEALTDGGDGAYIDQAVNASSLSAIRNAFAVGALKTKVAGCHDVATLDALIAITSVARLKDLLASNVELGYKDRPKFREALASTADINPLIAQAHIRKNIDFSDNPDSLKELIAINANPVAFKAKYHERFSTAATLRPVINTYFADGEKIKQARGQALIRYAQTELSEMDEDDVLDALIAADDHEAVKAQVNILLDVDDIADDLLGAPGEGVSKTIRIYAAIEKAISQADDFGSDISSADGDDEHTVLLARINRFEFDGRLGDLLRDEDCPPQQKGRVQAAWVEVLVRNYPDDRTALSELVKLAEKTTNLDEFKRLLTEQFGIDDTSWVNSSTMEQVQKAACIRAIESGVKHPLSYGYEAHPALSALIDELPWAKLQALLDNPAALTALAVAPSQDEVERVLGDRGLVDAELIDALVAENTGLLNIAKIANSEMARILAQTDPRVEVTDEILEAINDQLLNESIAKDDEYIDAITAIVAHFPPDSQNALYEQFGLNEDADNVAERDIADGIMAQHGHNEHLIARYHGGRTYPDSQAIILGLLTLSKNAPFPANRIIKNETDQGIVNDIRDSKTLAEFLSLTRDYRGVFEPPLEKQLTPQAFEQLKIEARSKAIASPRRYQAVLGTQKGEIDLIDQQFSQMVLEGRDRRKLKRLAEINPIYWFNPAFQAAAKQNAATMGPELRELAKQCDSYVTYLTNQQRVIQGQLDSLPSKREILAGVRASGGTTAQQKETTNAMSKAVDERRTELKDLSTRMAEELADYQNLQAVFNGDPDADSSTHPLMRQGLLKTLDMAAAGKSDIRLPGFGGHYVDRPISEKADHLAAGWGGEDRPGSAPSGHSVMSHEGFEENFDLVPAIPAGKFREHTVVFNKGAGRGEEKGLFIEERASHDVAGEIKPDGTVSYEPAVKLTASKFPPSHDARMYYAMAMASHMLAKLKTAPTADNPIKLRGGDPVQLRYLWTALMIVGELDNNLKFKQDAIKVFSAQFDPKAEFGMYGLRWDANAMYHKFKAHPQVGSWMSGIQEVNEKKFSKEELEARDQTIQDTSELTDFFKGKVTEIVKENKALEDSHGATLGSTGPTT